MMTSVWPAARIAKIEALSARLRSESVSMKRGSRIAGDRDQQRERDDDAELADAEDPLGRGGARARSARRGGGRRRPSRAHAAASRWPVAARMTLSSSASARRQLAGQPALVHDEHAVGHAEHLGQLAGDHQHRDALGRRARSSAGGPRPSCRRRCRASARRRSAPSGSVASHLASTTFCWLPPDRKPTRVVQAVELELQPRRPLARPARSSAPPPISAEPRAARAGA